MTTPIDEMEAGAELNALANSAVLDSDSPARAWLQPSIVDADALILLRDWQGDFDIRRQNGVWNVILYKPSREWEVWASTLALAISRAIAKTLEVQDAS